MVLVRNQGQMYYSLARSPLRLPGSADIYTHYIYIYIYVCIYIYIYIIWYFCHEVSTCDPRGLPRGEAAHGGLVGAAQPGRGQVSRDRLQPREGALGVLGRFGRRTLQLWGMEHGIYLYLYLISYIYIIILEIEYGWIWRTFSPNSIS